jgi:uncharacterized protein
MSDNLPNIENGLPVFPLTGVTLFPNTLMPLHIFEQRYRNLVEDTLRKPESEHCFAMGTMLTEPGPKVLGNPPVFEVCGVGRITEYSRLPDGRFMLVLQGVARAQLVEELPNVNHYRVFNATWLNDIEPPPGNPLESELVIELRAIALTLLREQADRFKSMLADDIRLGVLTDMMCGYLPFKPEFKLEQLATTNVLHRAARCITELEAMLGTPPQKPVKPDEQASNN